jgi:hypothetical protein
MKAASEALHASSNGLVHVVAPGSLLVDELAQAIKRAQAEQSEAGDHDASGGSSDHTPD